ncbi:hypothetical protein SAMN05421835_108190 [Amycolatopsis sacchari]|uniref:Uncharacterized protein n=1 Tax=Amycolatopsis sacchari TaxID=115433 RepID=A0A1I3TZK7_9PSEU|nr:hypothetical protein [Amycolatopsis sacchari]SFJ76738.1 hypothetical protein SAMN05421835_108190 [Amycolatopsis sacchari]
MGALKKVWDASVEWGASRGEGRVIAATSRQAVKNHCAVCGRKATRTTGTVRHCSRAACLRQLAALF